jgi:D-alanyl-D-alanine carboxypeptidase/D-alanyl-D-alanine-endopeptidase (penicillin-binding protein 4)
MARGPAAEWAAPILEDRTFRAITAGVHVVHVGTGEEVLAWQADRPLVPASTAKVVTAAAALDALGPSYLFTTEVWHTGTLDGGVVDGDLYLVGAGDPTMVAEKLWRLLRDLRTDGVERVEGDLVFDDDFFDESPLIPGWNVARDLADGPSYFPAIGAWNLEFGSVALVVRPGAEAGAPAIAVLETPAPGYVTVDADLVTGEERSRSRIELERVIADDRMTLKVSGTVALDARTRTFRRAVHDPTAFAMAVTQDLLRQVGPHVVGTVRRGSVPADAERIARRPSPPLASILMDTNKYSSNYMAETVLRTLGAEQRGQGTTAAGLEVVRAYLDRLGLRDDGLRLVNGSGLSRETRLSAQALTTVLRHVAQDPRTGPEFVASLSIGGQDGTLLPRFREHPSRVRGKTGTLAGVHSLAGYLEADDGELYAFAILANDVKGGLTPVKRWMDDLLVHLFGWPPPTGGDER